MFTKSFLKSNKSFQVIKLHNKQIKTILFENDRNNTCLKQISSKALLCVDFKSRNFLNNFIKKSYSVNFEKEKPKKQFKRIILNNLSKRYDLIKYINLYKEQNKEILKLKENLMLNKNKDLISSDEEIMQYKCSEKCLTVNRIYSRERLEEDVLSFFITDSRNKFKRDLNNLILEEKRSRLKKDQQIYIQISGLAGIGKTYSLADFAVIEKLKNFETKENLVFYHHFNEISNKYCLHNFLKEIFVSIYPLIEEEIQVFINSEDGVDVEIGSLFDNVLELFDLRKGANLEILPLIIDIFSNLKNNYPNKQIIVILDQINEVSKNKDELAHLKFEELKKEKNTLLEKLKTISDNKEISSTEDKYMLICDDIDNLIFNNPTIKSESLFKQLQRIKQNIVLIVCASNNNEFTRKNILESQSSKYDILNFDLNLTPIESILHINQMGFHDPKEIEAIYKVTRNVPLFLNNYLKKMVDENEKAGEKKKSNPEIIQYLVDKVKKEISTKAENFYKDYYSTKFIPEQKRLFKELLCSVNSRHEKFLFEKIKNVLDFQLLDFEIVEKDNYLIDYNINEEDLFLNWAEYKISVLTEFYDYLEDKINSKEKKSFSKIYRFPEDNDNVHIVCRYPSILKRYKEIFSAQNEDFPYKQLDALIRDFIEEYPQKFIKGSLDNITFDKIGYSFEDIFNLYIRINKKIMNVPYPKGFEFMKDWNNYHYYDAFDSEKTQTDSIISNNENNKNINKKRNLQTIIDKIHFFSESNKDDDIELELRKEEYPPSLEYFTSDLITGLYYNNKTRNLPTIDGGFAFLKIGKKLAQDENLKKIIDFSNQNIDEEGLNYLLFTYNISVNDKTDVGRKMDFIMDNLAKIYNTFQEKSLFTIKGGILKHYYVILENKVIYDVDDPLRKLNSSKNAILETTKTDKLYKIIGNNPKFGILVARFVKINYPNHKALSLQLLPYKPDDRKDI